ncbi:DUF4352 domain-containing protein [Streptomyces sp. NPDC001594]|uniref:DUF4352 domain-containing protein n=1 Tax=Streptomyces sp. NPDC001594 TaxID=3364590 RepID=UPI0036A1BDA0
MRTHHLASATVGVALLALTACGPTNEITTKPDAKGAPPSPTVPAPAAPSKPAPGKVAAVGDTVTLKGNGDGEQLAVTIKKWADPAQSADDFMKPQDGKRWVAAQFELVNTGTAVYNDSPSNGTQVADAEGQQFHTTFGEITAGPAMTSAAKASPGGKVLGWIVYEVPKDSKIVKVQFAMNSGFASQTGEWIIP